MPQYSEQEKDQIIREYFGPAGVEENPRCPHCGEVLRFDSDYRTDSPGFRVDVACPDCGAGFTWEQSKPEQPWKPLHLAYFVERYKLSDVLRCPVDDCYVVYAEFSDGVLEFRCPYCNRRGKSEPAG